MAKVDPSATSSVRRRRRSVPPGLTAAAVFGDRNGLDSGEHSVGVEVAFEVVDFVGDEAGEAAVEGGDVAGAGGVLVFDVDGEGAGDAAADVEEGQAAFVLFVGVGGLVDDPRVVDDRAARWRSSRARDRCRTRPRRRREGKR